MVTDKRRIRKIKEIDNFEGDVVYWMSRDQRLDDNWALYYAYELAKERGTDLSIVFVKQENFLNSHDRNYNFMMQGLRKVWERSWSLGIPFHFVYGEPADAIDKHLKNSNIDTLITEQSPLKVKDKWLKEVKKLELNIYEVDAHNLIPVWEASEKQEYAAHTIRKKLMSRISEFSDLPPMIEKNKKPIPRPLIEIPEVDNELEFVSGEDEALNTLKLFISNKLKDYSDKRNDPNEVVLSNLSPYMHFGQIYIGRILEELPSRSSEGKDAFVEEIYIRRELADNFCYYNKKYDSFEGLHEWAQTTLNEHRDDKREYIYTKDQFEEAITDDPAWNAAQIEMVKTGKMHGYMRMYWAKKILEWSESPEKAIDIAIYLNNKYSIDGRDPNGYVGILWSIGGLHDRPWFERPIFGKVRYMAYSGLKRKFDVEKYINKWISNVQYSFK